jgi:hypothetical protein
MNNAGSSRKPSSDTNRYTRFHDETPVDIVMNL